MKTIKNNYGENYLRVYKKYLVKGFATRGQHTNNNTVL